MPLFEGDGELKCHKPEMDYDPVDIRSVKIYSESTASIEHFKRMVDQGYEVVFWLPYYGVGHHFIGIEYFMAKRQPVKRDLPK